MKKEVKLSILLRTSDMYHFLLNHTYSNFSGIFGIVVSMSAFLYLVLSFQDNDVFKNVVLIIASLLFTVINPLLLLSKAKQQITLNPMFKEPLNYTINDDVILVSQKEQQLQINWDEIFKVIETKKSIIIYLTTVRAYIFPKESCKESYPVFLELLTEHVDKSKCKLKK